MPGEIMALDTVKNFMIVFASVTPKAWINAISRELQKIKSMENFPNLFSQGFALIYSDISEEQPTLGGFQWIWTEWVSCIFNF